MAERLPTPRELYDRLPADKRQLIDAAARIPESSHRPQTVLERDQIDRGAAGGCSCCPDRCPRCGSRASGIHIENGCYCRSYGCAASGCGRFRCTSPVALSNVGGTTDG